jgi:hypothetical protein
LYCNSLDIGFGFPKYSLTNVVEELVYMFPIGTIVFNGYSKSSMRARSLAWLMEPKAFLKSMYGMYISLLVSLVFFSAPIKI